jgi:hypothetical protein
LVLSFLLLSFQELVSSKTGQLDPDVLGIRDPAEPGQRDPAVLGHLDPAFLGQRDPAVLGQRFLAEPGKFIPAKPGHLDQVAPVATGPLSLADPDHLALVDQNDVSTDPLVTKTD